MLFVLYNTPGLSVTEEPFLFVAWWSFVFAILVTVVISLLTKPEPEEKLRGLVWSSVVTDKDVQDALKERVTVMDALATLVARFCEAVFYPICPDLPANQQFSREDLSTLCQFLRGRTIPDCHVLGRRRAE